MQCSKKVKGGSMPIDCLLAIHSFSDAENFAATANQDSKGNTLSGAQPTA
jgi:hypothetical protein